MEKYTIAQLNQIAGDLGKIEAILQQRDIMVEMMVQQEKAYLKLRNDLKKQIDEVYSYYGCKV